MLMKNETFQIIWDLQYNLNLVVGLDSINIGQNGQSKDHQEWLENFMDEFQNEIFEAKENFLHKWWIKEVKDHPERRFEIIDMAKLKVEIIDMLHFLITACQIYAWGDINIFFQELEQTMIEVKQNKLVYNDKPKDVYRYLSQISKCVNPIYAMEQFHILCEMLNMNDDEVLKIYKLKWEKNMLRQKNNYSQATKSEIDNNEIEEKIR